MKKVIDFCNSNSIFYKQDISARSFSTFRIGGIAPLIVYPNNALQASSVISFMYNENIPYKIAGNCSNILFPDEDLDYVLLKTDKLNSIEVSANKISCGAGVILAKAATTALKYDLSGMECLFGIPGTVGGAVAMNAGAYGREMSHIVCSTEYVDHFGNIKTVEGQDHDFGYRHSFFSTDGFITQTTLELSYGTHDEIKRLMDECTSKRTASQPLDMPSAGSVFKRPEGYFAGKLIQDSGLKGFTVGGAQVSEKHVGFIVNKGNATSADVKNLIITIQTTVLEKYGVHLETEIKFF